MYTRRKNKSSLSDTNLDPLMDVITCTVGVMLFVVIFAVIGARGVSFKFFTPLQSADTPVGKSRNLFICKEGKIKLLDLNSAYDNLYEMKFTYNNMPRLIRLANERILEDEYFEFSYSMGENSDYYNKTRWPIMHIKEINQDGGDDKDQIILPDSKIANIIRNLDPDENWIAFALYDELSIEVFREARSLANLIDIENGWDPIKVDFPFSIELDNSSGDSGEQLFKPQ